jgi:hypothetical protein
MKKLFVIATFCCLLSGLAQAQTIPFSGQFPYNVANFRGSNFGPWGVPDDGVPLVGAGAYCPPSQSLIGITIGPCSELISIGAGGGKAPNVWVLYSSGFNYRVLPPPFGYDTEQWYYWTSCDVMGAMERSYDNPTGTNDGSDAPESC